MAGMPQAVWSRPVIRPASRPLRNEQSSASHGLTPEDIRMTQTAPPVASEPSTVRSAISSIRKVMYTPIAMTPISDPAQLRSASNRRGIERSLELP